MSAALRTRAELSPMEKAFLEAMQRGLSSYEAAADVGLDAGDVTEVMARPAFQAAMDQAIRRNLQEGAFISGYVLKKVVSGAEQCSPTRLDAMKTVLDRSGYNTPSARPAPRFADADLSELSADELRRLVDGLERAKGKTIDALAERAKPVDAPRQNTLDDKLLSLLD